MFLVTIVGSDLKKKMPTPFPDIPTTELSRESLQRLQNISEIADANILPLKKDYKNM